jgi:hypothetical protein
MFEPILFRRAVSRQNSGWPLRLHYRKVATEHTERAITHPQTGRSEPILYRRRSISPGASSPAAAGRQGYPIDPPPYSNWAGRRARVAPIVVARLSAAQVWLAERLDAAARAK